MGEERSRQEVKRGRAREGRTSRASRLARCMQVAPARKTPDRYSTIQHRSLTIHRGSGLSSLRGKFRPSTLGARRSCTRLDGLQRSLSNSPATATSRFDNDSDWVSAALLRSTALA